ncbi:hypothetical protein CFAEC_04730 [Corynebacterium faecale]|uniref:DUF488 domain-containing protein n=1 Tax=Corynebacterium faecale TaxID=1758466 RepID=UPI0025B37EEF|nr:DUF488 domain-containing protein [Corynebacterium faecale]WJY91792.1 hypothetical protein CFAEC_04730 [Corynebacterium faecale]
MVTVFTVGHSTHNLQTFLDMLAENGVEKLIDVRKLPGSRKFPHFDQEKLSTSLDEVGIAYAWSEPLTGHRPVSRTVPFEVNGFWQNRSFHNYADHALSGDFMKAVAHLMQDPARSVLLCSEAVWWRCHRRIITDHLLARGAEVIHIMGPGQTSVATLTSGAVVEEKADDTTVTYPATD